MGQPKSADARAINNQRRHQLQRLSARLGAGSAQARIAELSIAYCAAESDAMTLRKRATAAEARNAEVSMLAHRWMEAHDRLKAGLDYDLPTPADLPNEKARADRLAKALEALEAERKREGVNLAHLKRAVAVAYADMNRAAPTGAK